MAETMKAEVASNARRDPRRDGAIVLLVLLLLVGIWASVLVNSGQRAADANERLATTEERETAIFESSRASSSWDGLLARHGVETPLIDGDLAASVVRHRAAFDALRKEFPAR